MTLELADLAPVYSGLREEPFWNGPVADPSKALAGVNNAVLDLDEEIKVVFRKLRDCFSPRLPELPSLGLATDKFAAVVKIAGHEADLSRVSFGSCLPPSEAMAVKLTVAASKGRALSPDELRLSMSLADLILQMLEMRGEMLKFVEDQVRVMAPNTAALVGTKVAARLIAATGGVRELALCPSNNLQVIGYDPSKAADLQGYSLIRLMPHVGFVGECDMVKDLADSDYAKVAVRLLAAKLAMASRADAARSHSDGAFGLKLKAEVEARLEKRMEPAPYKIDNPLPPPITQARKKRGGKRARRLKELTAPTELRRLQNRIAFGTATEDDLVLGDTVVVKGMIGSSSGPKITAIDTKLRERIKKQSEKALTGIYSSRPSTDNPFAFDSEKGLLLKKL